MHSWDLGDVQLSLCLASRQERRELTWMNVQGPRPVLELELELELALAVLVPELVLVGMEALQCLLNGTKTVVWCCLAPELPIQGCSAKAMMPLMRMRPLRLSTFRPRGGV
mmetsp:Transcript_2625/g.7821  ORF Transcript_2625/g.7821 Transcript_2625/m.7821 type:complete len:111 (+) Transcript_2625:673-1005(+)